MTHASSAWAARSRPSTSNIMNLASNTLWIAAIIHSCVAGIVATSPVPQALPTWFPWALAGLIVLEVLVFSLAAWKLQSYWPLLIGIIALKLGGVVTSLIALNQGMIAPGLAISTAVFDGIWSIILARVLAWVHRDDAKGTPVMSLAEAITTAKDQTGQSLDQLSDQSPVLVVFLRHFGCTFCREALSDLSKQRPQIEAAGTTIALVHMGTEEEANFMLDRYGLAKIHHISDPLRRTYRAFALRRGSFGQLFGWKVWLRGFRSGILEGHGLGKLQGDGFQLPGVFLLDRGQVISEYRHQSAADRPDYRQFAENR